MTHISDTTLQQGLANRRQVLGDAWVEQSLRGANRLNVEFQRLITTYAWDSIWSRPGLDRRTRRIMVLATTAAMGRWEEFELHVRGAIRNGLTPEELKEVILQITIYCGVPAAIEASRHANKVLEEMRENGELAA